MCLVQKKVKKEIELHKDAAKEKATEATKTLEKGIIGASFRFLGVSEALKRFVMAREDTLRMPRLSPEAVKKAFAQVQDVVALHSGFTQYARFMHLLCFSALHVLTVGTGGCGKDDEAGDREVHRLSPVHSDFPSRCGAYQEHWRLGLCTHIFLRDAVARWRL